jgi:hypothetical protein
VKLYDTPVEALKPVRGQGEDEAGTGAAGER